ncbi:arginine--tRNA ligase [Algoriphagus halophytocola]|uniref:Arginine--tRNA ligase n=1 Tax=Algoriphagus halophytocola TaxID=2991499 RepID=A0ABY6MMT4_9BACT|nr:MULTISPECIES: arginine--tRNA ligase [unclassified Algoriphagus]UZD23636.1 arginine--tRNA ligase [Algoriphagus sp. TR-M5]WBL44929.1 arginine--tRNA ligase [Algoriphagus sp. TR-M9]
MNIQESIHNGIQLAFQNIFNHELPLDQISLAPTRKEFKGTYTFVVFPYLKVSKTTPEATANLLGDYLKENVSEVSGFNVMKGFLNLELDNRSWLDVFQKLFTYENLGQLPAKGEKVMVEYSSPNTNKPLHLGHLRNNFLGFAVAQILEANGYEVIKANLVNDRGIHICKSMVAYLHFGNGETPESSGLKGDHLAGKYYVIFDQKYKEEIAKLKEQGQSEEEAKKNAPLLLEAQDMLRKWEANDEEVVTLWKQMNEWVYAGFDKTYERMGVSFDQYYYESNTYLLGKDIVTEGLEKGVFFKKENGSVWVDLTDEGLDEKLVLRGDGTSVYITQDMGTADLKYDDFGISKSVYVVGNEQDYHFDVLFKIMRKLGRPYGEGLYHLSYGMVDLPTGKMKSREGTVVDADDLMQEMVDTAAQHTKELGKIDGFNEAQAAELYETLGLGALKYFLLKVDPKKRMLFNPQESIEFQGNTGPFIQYSHARIASILRKADQIGVAYQNADFSQIAKIEESESSLIYLLNEFEKKIAQAGTDYSPAILAQYLFDLAKEYNRFYADLPIFLENDSSILAFRVALSAHTAKTLKKGMKLLGITVPDRM